MEDQKQVSNGELLAVINEIKSQMVTKEVLEAAISKLVTKEIFEESISDLANSLNFVTQNAATEVQVLESEARLKRDIDFLRFDLPSKDFVTMRIGELKGSFVEAFKNNDAKTNKLSEILLQRKVINESDNNEIMGMVPFPRPKMI